MAGFRLGWRIAIALAATALSVTMAQAQSWPSRPVKVIMATAAGSAPDVIARIVTDRLSQLWGQQVLILNRPGAGGLIALQALAAAERDGHTLYMPTSSSLVVLPVTNSNLPLNIERDLAPIALVGEQPFAIIASNSLGISTLPELVALAKKKPGELTYAANFRGSLPNMTGESFSERAGISLTFVPYPGASQGLQDVLGGRVSVIIDGLAAFMSPIASNAVKPLAITSPKRLPNYPDLPAVNETVAGFDSRGWISLLSFAGTPDDVVRKVNADLRTVLDVPEVRQRFETLATYVRHMTPAETGKFIRDEQEAWRPVVKKVGVISP
ncbi:Bug family tripartite tricarboxylate transporter substrate binding protein [Rhodoplanes sp. Z2-YC6860]|uniref:Bug family tripartite tricarboxylate transporter substrate binding protein n=1 Tax=Rhodoplanes sp. Z2-YC6860 TaxID=674703 RepID=UPI00078E440D|nr:tripartite tricarboxylate transporter substrate-binding protein [Rhodoplanes sp. Z2-YC6860]AMN42350.1 extra-cytoplasmic solute receptor [Rhodoplanes sp. Z2-YC6860]